MNKNVKTVLIACLIIVGIAALAVGVYFMILPTDKEVFSNSLKESFNDVKSLTFKSNDNFFGFFNSEEGESFRLTTNTIVNDGTENFTFSGDLYSKLNDAYAKLSLKEQNSDDDLEIEILKKADKIYHKLNNVYSRFYYTELENSININNYKMVDMSVIFDYFTDAIIEHVDDDNLSKEDKDLTLSGESYNTKRYTATFTQKDFLEILKDTLNKCKDNQELYESINEMLEMLKQSDNSISDSSITSGLDLSNFDDVINEADDKEKFFTYSVSVYNGKTISNEIAFFIKSEESDVTIRVTLNSYENKNGYNNFEMYVSMMGFKVIGFEMEGTSDTKSNISMYIMDGFNISGTCELSDDLFGLDLTIATEMEDEEGHTNRQELFKINIDGKEVVKDKEYDINIKCDMPSETGNIELVNSTNKLILGENIPEIDISDSASIDEMSEEEKLALDSITGMLGDNNNDFDYEGTY